MRFVRRLSAADGRRRRLTAATAAVLLIAIAAGCTGTNESSQSADPYASDLERARAEATSPLETAILDDLEIERHEYEEAVNAYVGCLNNRGFAATAVPQGGYFVYSIPSGADSAADECRIGTIDLIEGIYVNTLMNPQRRDMNELIVECLISKGAAPQSYTPDDLARDLGTGLETAPFEFDDRFDACMANPSAQ